MSFLHWGSHRKRWSYAPKRQETDIYFCEIFEKFICQQRKLLDMKAWQKLLCSHIENSNGIEKKKMWGNGEGEMLMHKTKLMSCWLPLSKSHGLAKKKENENGKEKRKRKIPTKMWWRQRRRLSCGWRKPETAYMTTERKGFFIFNWAKWFMSVYVIVCVQSVRWTSVCERNSFECRLTASQFVRLIAEM